MRWLSANWFHVGLLLCAAALASFACWGIVGARHDSAALVTQANANLRGIDDSRKQIVTEFIRPCKGPANTPDQAADNCGFLAETKKAEVFIRDAVTTTQLQVKNSQKLMNAASSAILDASIDVHTSTEHANALLDQAKQDLKTGNGTLASAKTALDGLSSFETTAQLDADRIHALLTDQRVDKMIGDAGTVSDNAAAMSTMANQVTQKEGKSILKPSKWGPIKPWAILGAKTAACIWAGAC